MKNNLTKSISAGIGFLLLPQSVGIIAGVITSSSVKSWYSTLVKPSFTPPSIIFGPVWTVLYLLMGVSAFLIWNKRKKFNTKTAMLAFSFQLLLNFCWSLIFFGLANPLLAFVEIILLWFIIIYMVFTFYRIDKNAAYLQIPYVLWVSFALMLNLYIVLLN